MTGPTVIMHYDKSGWLDVLIDRHKATLTKIARMENGLTVIEGGQ